MQIQTARCKFAQMGGSRTPAQIMAGIHPVVVSIPELIQCGMNADTEAAINAFSEPVKGNGKNQNLAIRRIVPSRMPSMNVDADNIYKTIYPTIIPILSGI